jgi:hypothetical protein
MFLQEQAQQSVVIQLSIRNNLWSHYNAKSIKSKLYELEKNRLALTAQLTLKNDAQAILGSIAGNLDREINRYNKEQSDIKNEAVRYDTLFELARRREIAYSISALIAQVSLFSFLAFLILRLQKLRYVILIILFFLASLATTAYATFFI